VGVDARRWRVEEILDRGLALATMYRGDIDPDLNDGSVQGLRSFYPDLAGRGDNFSAIAAWAWALSRAMDYIESDSCSRELRLSLEAFCLDESSIH
jgi:hypothetical protein